ncbi:MAG: GSCFA domain-containing protein [Bacteroidota bacterium]
MKLITQIPQQKAQNPIDYDSRVFLTGSCFSENMGRKLDYFKFRSFQNPFGILFHPKAIETLVVRSVTQDHYLEEEVFYHNERWHCFDAHSDLSDVSKKDLIKKLNNRLMHTHERLKNATHFIFTLGTAWSYKHKDGNAFVANCHKIPQKEFSKVLLSITEIKKSLGAVMENIRKVNEQAQVIFTISPVRHLKDGFRENQRSKAHLIAAIHDMVQNTYSKSHISYFESYELMMDELRDYRFYEVDMVHPNELAVDYIWQRFRDIWISEKIFPMMDRVEAVQKDLKHKFFDPGSVASQKFRAALQEKIAYLQKEHPFMEFSE